MHSFVQIFRQILAYFYKIICTMINPHPAVISKSLILWRGGQLAHRRKSAVLAIFLHTKQQKIFKGTLGTQDLTSKGSKTSHGPSMDPTGPLNWSSKFQAMFTTSTLYTL